MTLWEYLDRRATRRRPSRLSFRDWLAMFLITAFIAALFYLLRTAFPQQNEQLIVYMLGQLSGFTGTAIALYYTLSKHDEQRSDQTEKLLDVARDANATTKAALEAVTPTPQADVTLQPGQTARAADDV